MTLSQTPKTIDAAVSRLCAAINPEARPVYLEIKPDPDSESLDCFHNVRRKAEREGGEIQLGWAIWTWPRVFVEAEHHAVYLSPEGQLIDTTPPQAHGITRRLFLPDAAAVYDFANEGVRRDNIRHALSNDPLIRSFFSAAERRTAILNAIPGIGMIAVDERIARQIAAAEEAVAQIQVQLAAKYTKPNDPCICGSGTKFKRCHGRLFR